MKTVGEILTRSRIQKGISLDELSDRTRIDVKYIKALEENDFRHLPSPTFAKGFIRNISIALDRDPDEIIAVFRRDFQTTKKKLPSSAKNKFPSGPNFLFQSQVPLIFLAVSLFLGYLGYQYRTVLVPPKLEVIEPRANQVVTSPVTIEGLSTVDSIITINDQQEANTDQSGHFIVQLNLSTGSTELKIQASNRFSRTSTKLIPITVISQ